MLEQWVRCITPKALFLQGVSVLHASACSFGDSLVAFCGDSGAGKTTTARAFAAAGRPLHSEDLVVVDPGGEVPAAFIEAEPAIRRWAADSGALLARQADYVIDSRGLRALVCKGRVRALAGLLFVERGRRSGTEVRSEQISPVDSLAGLLQACFLGSADRDSWRVFVRSNTAVARSTRGANLWVPDGIEALTKAAARFDYNASSTS
jgi:hypothetical protein